MPTNNSRTIDISERRRHRTLEDDRADRDQRVKESQARTARTAGQSRLELALNNLLAPARQFRDHRDSQNHHEEAKAQLQLENPELDRGGLMVTIGAVLIGLVKWPAVIAIDFLLLAAVSHLLISLVYVRPEGPPWWSLFLVPMALFAFELVVAAHIAIAANQAQPGDRNASRSLRGWRVLGGVLAVVVPAIGTAALLTSLGTSQFDLGGVGLLLALGVVALAAVCHWTVIFGGASAMQSLARLVFLPRLWWLRRRIRNAQRAAQIAQDTARDAIRVYDGELTAYRVEHGEPPQHLLIQLRDRDLINAAVGEQVIAPPADEPADPVNPATPAADSRIDNASRVTDAVGERHPPREPQSAPPAATDPDDGAAAEADYLRRILDARVRDADGEVQP